MRNWLSRWVFGGLLCSACALGAASDTPDFKEVQELIRSNAAIDDAELNRAAVEGLLSKLSSRARLIDPSKSSHAETNVTPVPSNAIFDEHFGYVRVARVSSKLAEEFSATLEKLSATNKLKGLVIDLRFAVGSDYAAAAKVADRFLASEQPVLDWGKGFVNSTDKTNAFREPVAILVNHYTSGAAEALAGVLRHKDVGLLIGTNTAGEASITKDFPLKNGSILRIAVSPVKVGDGKVIEQLKPDIRVDVSPEDERAYFVDAYKSLARPGNANSTNVASLTVTNKPRRRINEAELVRMLREGENPEEETERAARSAEPAKPTITDPALARAIDLLKALAVVRPARS